VPALFLGGFFVFNQYIYNKKQGAPVTNYKEVTFWISGEPVSLRNGEAQAYTDLGGGVLTTIRYFGNEVRHDIDGDGNEDIVFLVTQEIATGDTLFYAVGALKRGNAYTGTHAVYLGENIAPQTTQGGEGRQIIVNYAERATGDEASIGKSMYLLLDPGTLEFGEVVQDFEGEVY